MSQEKLSTSEFVAYCLQSKAEQRPQRLAGCFHQRLIFLSDPRSIRKAVLTWGSMFSRICIFCCFAVRSACLLCIYRILEGLRGEEGKKEEMTLRRKEGVKIYPENQAIKCNSSEISLLNLHCYYQNKQVSYEDFFPSYFSMIPW